MLKKVLDLQFERKIDFCPEQPLDNFFTNGGFIESVSEKIKVNELISSNDKILKIKSNCVIADDNITFSEVNPFPKNFDKKGDFAIEKNILFSLIESWLSAYVDLREHYPLCLAIDELLINAMKSIFITSLVNYKGNDYDSFIEEYKQKGLIKFEVKILDKGSLLILMISNLAFHSEEDHNNIMRKLAMRDGNQEESIIERNSQYSGTGTKGKGLRMVKGLLRDLKGDLLYLENKDRLEEGEQRLYNFLLIYPLRDISFQLNDILKVLKNNVH